MYVSILTVFYIVAWKRVIPPLGKKGKCIMKRIGNNRILLLASVLSFIAPFLAAAQITFERNYGGPYDDIGYSAQQTSDGGYIVAGYTNKEPFPFGDRDVFLIRVDSLGDTIWTKTYGNSLEDGAYSV
ncbi:hypothetical protein CH333_10160, partial [candidate division WOR-3 bacterium JGI_Cruoil_03_44_89]